MKLQDYLKENMKKDPDGLFLISGEKSYTSHQFYEEVDGYVPVLKELGYRKEWNMTEKNIKDQCNERMASFKVPDLVEFVSALPKDASGKVIKISLRMLDKN